MPIAGYKKLLEISISMLELAQQQEWEAMVTAESERAALLTEISTKRANLSMAERDALANIICEIQNCDRAILNYISPWQEHVTALLSRLEPLS